MQARNELRRIKIMTEKENDLPEFLYKYINIERGLSLISESKIWFSSPENFNDPFDCHIDLINFKPNEKQIKEIINEKVEGNNRTRRIEIQKNKRNPYRIINQFSTQANDFFKNSGVFCFSEIPDNMLLWSHYGDNHKGICLKFSKDITKISTLTDKVNYTENYERKSFYEKNGESIYHLLFTKSEDWKYEKEIRSVNILENGKVDFPIENLKEIIFGCRIDENEMKRIKEKIKELNLNHIKFKTAKQEKLSFKLKIE